MIHDTNPDGFILDGLLAWENIGTGGVVAQGFRIQTLDMRSASDHHQDEVRDKLVALYQSLPTNYVLQHRFRPSTTAAHTLDAYDAVTETSQFERVRATRHAISRRFRALHAGRKLRSEEVTLYVGTKVTNSAGFGLSRDAGARHMELVVAQYRAELSRFGDQIRSTFGEFAIVEQFDEAAHFRALSRTLDPSLDESPSIVRAYRPDLSICEQTFNASVAGVAAHGIYVNGYYQAFITLQQAPNRSQSVLFGALTSLPFNDYEVVVNAQLVDVRQLVKAKEKTIATLKKENIDAAGRGEDSVSKDETKNMEEAEIRRIERGSLKVLKAAFIVRVWAKTEAELTSMAGLAKRAIESMNGAQAYHAALATESRKLFFASWPGWSFGYDKTAINIADIDLADVVPLTSTFQGRLDAPEILLDGGKRRNEIGSDNPRALVAIPSFLGTPPSPQHTLVVGSTGAGKTTTISNALFQSSPYYGYEVILEEGSDYTPYALAHGSKTIRVQADGTHTINYLDTGGLPLSNLHVSFASSLAMHFAGTTKQNPNIAQRSAMATQYIRAFYASAAADWLRKHRDLARQVQREAFATREWHRLRMTNDDSLTDAWAVIRDGIAANSDEISNFVAAMKEDDVFRFANEPNTRQIVENHSFTRFKPEDYPQHAAFAEMVLTHKLPEYEAREVNEFASMLRKWTANEGDYGPLFDGVTTIPLDSRVVHFELGKIPEEQKELKTAVALLMTGKVRQNIVNMPRTIRKRAVIEEMMRFLDVPDADKLIVEFCAQMRKYNCVVWMIIQQLEKLLATGIAPFVIGNCRQYLILKQLSSSDVKKLANELPAGLPESLQEDLRTFPTPENLPASDRYSSLVYYNPNLTPPLAGSARLYLPKI